MVDSFRKGRRIHTRWDRKVEQITVAPAPRPAPEQQMPVEAGDAAPVRANLFVVHHRPDEFIIDFGFVPPGTAKGRITQRAITSPAHAKALCRALERVVK